MSCPPFPAVSAQISTRAAAETRLANLYHRLKDRDLNSIVVSRPVNISYLTGYLSRDSFLVVSPKRNVYVTDSRYTEEARQYLRDIAVVERIKVSAIESVASVIHKLGIKKTGFEEENLSFAEYNKLRKLLGRNTIFIPTHGLVEGLRQIKDNNELQKIKKAIMITLAAYRYIQKFLKPGIREIEIVGEIERFIHRHGARACAFEIIVASGPHAAYPHHVTSNRKLQNNEMVLIDMGVDYQGYKSDLTRTFFLGRIKPLANKVYTIVEQTQSHVVKLIRPGILSRELDAAARQYIWRQGYGPFFSHNLGHGVGLEIHEAPFLSSKSQTQLEAGMVFTVEPGIYLAGRLGVRIEDMVLVTDKGAQVL